MCFYSWKLQMNLHKSLSIEIRIFYFWHSARVVRKFSLYSGKSCHKNWSSKRVNSKFRYFVTIQSFIIALATVRYWRDYRDILSRFFWGRGWMWIYFKWGLTYPHLIRIGSHIISMFSLLSIYRLNALYFFYWIDTWHYEWIYIHWWASAINEYSMEHMADLKLVLFGGKQYDTNLINITGSIFCRVTHATSTISSTEGRVIWKKLKRVCGWVFLLARV